MAPACGHNVLQLAPLQAVSNIVEPDLSWSTSTHTVHRACVASHASRLSPFLCRHLPNGNTCTSLFPPLSPHTAPAPGHTLQFYTADATLSHWLLPLRFSGREQIYSAYRALTSLVQVQPRVKEVLVQVGGWVRGRARLPISSGCSSCCFWLAHARPAAVVGCVGVGMENVDVWRAGKCVQLCARRVGVQVGGGWRRVS